jgi:hypothetical protein
MPPDIYEPFARFTNTYRRSWIDASPALAGLCGYIARFRLNFQEQRVIYT